MANKIQVNIEYLIEELIQATRLPPPGDEIPACTFSIPEPVSISFDKSGAMHIADTPGSEPMTEDCVAKFSWKGYAIPFGKESFFYILSPAGYKKVRRRFEVAIIKHKPTYNRLPPNHPKQFKRITIEDVDLVFAEAWKAYTNNCKKKLKKLQANTKKYTQEAKRVVAQVI